MLTGFVDGVETVPVVQESDLRFRLLAVWGISPINFQLNVGGTTSIIFSFSPLWFWDEPLDHKTVTAVMP